MIYRLLQQTLPRRLSKKSFLKALTAWLHPYSLILDAQGAQVKQFAGNRAVAGQGTRREHDVQLSGQQSRP